MNRGFSQRGDGQGEVPVQGGLERPLRFQTVVSGFSVAVEISMGWMDGWMEKNEENIILKFECTSWDFYSKKSESLESGN